MSGRDDIDLAVSAPEEGANTRLIFPDMEETRRQEEEQCRLELEQMRTELLGDFNTGQACNCGKAIIDHAAIPTPAFDPGTRFVQLEPSREIKIFRRLIRHDYHCDACGAVYASVVIEGSRGYVPREKVETKV